MSKRLNVYSISPQQMALVQNVTETYKGEPWSIKQAHPQHLQLLPSSVARVQPVEATLEGLALRAP
jgi:hypothetical protein